MTAQTILSSFLPGQTGSSFRLRSRVNGSIIATETATETTSGSAIYTAVFNDIAEGTYYLQLLRNSDSRVLADKIVKLLLVEGTYVAEVVICDSALTEEQEQSLEDIVTAMNNISSTQLAAITLTPGVIANFPDELVIGDSYTEETGRIRILIVDDDGDPVLGVGSLLFEDAIISFAAYRANDHAVLQGECSFHDDDGTYVLLSLSANTTATAKAEYTYEGRLQFYWPMDVGSDDDQRKTYKTTPFKFISNPL